MKATDVLMAAADEMRARGTTYDQPEGERSMAKVVAIFNLHHDADMTEEEGWHFMQILKDVRYFSAGHHRDSAIDGVAYAALRAEAGANRGEQW